MKKLLLLLFLIPNLVMADCQGYEEGVTSFNEHPHGHKSGLDKIKYLVKYLGCE